MFGEYALYCDGVVVALVCDDTLFVKILPPSISLEKVCEKGPAYPGSKDFYVVEESEVGRIEDLPHILREIAKIVPMKVKKKKKMAAAKTKR
jgi:TfoX/Sxy family transcriptional regulator of competence genes